MFQEEGLNFVNFHTSLECGGGEIVHNAWAKFTMSLPILSTYQNRETHAKKLNKIFTSRTFLISLITTALSVATELPCNIMIII